MNILIDTHILIWYIEGNEKLSARYLQLIESKDNNLYFSVVSLWEMAIKISIDKLKINCPLKDFIPDGINILAIELDHLLNVQELPFYHKDPFDRLIIAQAIKEQFYLMSIDENFANYEVNLL